jgi:O-6-methylguanine DNA methyltransferase
MKFWRHDKSVINSSGNKCFDGQKIHSAIVRHPLTTLIAKGIVRGKKIFLVEIIIGTRAHRISSNIPDSPQDPFLSPIVRTLRAYLDNKKTDFSTIPIALDGMSAFQSSVLRAARVIPYGATLSYAQLANQAGHPRAVRAAASVMRKNPLPLIIPCHRVIRQDGSSGAYAGDFSGKDAALKQSLLRMEAGGKVHH